MPARLNQPDIDTVPTRRVTGVTPGYRDFDPCASCLRRLIDEVLRQAFVEDAQIPTPSYAAIR
jgi:hypothetical protein